MNAFAKRALDFTVATVGLILLSPLIAVTAVAIWILLGPPVLFRQKRPGYHAQPFILLKFRTMTEARSTEGALLPDTQRLTNFGKFLRALSLDELPQLWNVLRGEMSLVGPRPLLVQYLDRYTAEQARRHNVRPGLTGWAQINGRNATTWEERFACDSWYVDHASFALDLRILALTALRVLQRRGATAGKSPTMPEFMGAAAMARKASADDK
jgi:lipopolysaccharide/colanic/teichoic acid biosynthesis glycosyltransferase